MKKQMTHAPPCVVTTMGDALYLKNSDDGVTTLGGILDGS